MIQNIIKRIIVGVGIALILSFIGSKISNASVIPVNPSQYIIRDTNIGISFTPNGTGSVGVGYLVGNIMVTRQEGDFVQPVWTATLFSGGKYYGCEMGTVATSDSSLVGTVVVQTFKCPVTLDGSNNVGQLFFALSQNGVNSGNGVISIGRASIVLDENTQLLTEIRNAQLQEIQYIMQYLQPIYSRLGGTNDFLYGISKKIDTFITQSEENSQKQEENQKVCDTIDKNSVKEFDSRLTENGKTYNNNNYGVTDYIKISKSTNIKLLVNVEGSTANYSRLCFYNINKDFISCISQSEQTPGELITVPNNADYVRFTIRYDLNKPQFQICKNGNQAIVDSQNDINNTLNDDSVDEPNDYSSNVATNGVITQLITLPITLFQKILNSTSASCTPFNLGSLYGHDLTMPCINLQKVLGNTLFNVIDILISGLFIYAISRKMVKVFNSLSSMKEGDVING